MGHQRGYQGGVGKGVVEAQEAVDFVVYRSSGGWEGLSVTAGLSYCFMDILNFKVIPEPLYITIDLHGL